MDEEEPTLHAGESKHHDEFKRRVEAYVRAGGDTKLVWIAIDDLGSQVSTVRHDQVEMRQETENLNARLFGYKAGLTPDFAAGGVFGSLTRKIESEAKNQTEDLKNDIRWVLRIGATFVSLLIVIVGAVVGYLLTGHSL